jgi:ATP-dependent RNA helicase DDX5/DBP2
MGKRGKRNRSLRKEPITTIGEEGNKRDDKAASLVVTYTGDDTSFIIPPPFVASDLNEQELLAPLRRSWTVVENRGKKAGSTTTWSPTPIQLQTWSILLRSRIDMIGIAPTGSGKTYAYGLPLLNQIDVESDTGIQGIVLIPTRELALQAEKDLKRTKCRNVSIVAVYGGVDRDTQLKALSSEDSPLVVTGTPGRLGDLLNVLKGNMSNLKWVVMDEADRMATQVDMSKQVDDIMETLGKDVNRRICLFSATFPEAASKWNDWISEKHVVVKVNIVTVGQAQVTAAEEGQDAVPTSAAVNEEESQANDNEIDEHPKKKHHSPLDLARIPSNVTQILHVCSAHKKPRKLVTTLQKVRSDKKNRTQSLCLVFFARIKTLQYVSKLLQKDGFPSAELHSHLSQKDRERVLFNFQCGKIQTLLATDVAARGIHVPNVDSVINYDFPISLEQYVHRCGRAGRSGNKPATVYSFFTRELQPMAKDVVTLLTETNAWIDPNLLELTAEKAQEGRRSKRRKLDDAAKSPAQADANVECDNDDAGEDQYAFLNPNRIVLKRASHVSDASSESEAEEET